MTTVPVFTVRVEGSNAKFLIAIAFPPPGDTGGATGARGASEEEQPAPMQAMITRAIQAEQVTTGNSLDIVP